MIRRRSGEAYNAWQARRRRWKVRRATPKWLTEAQRREINDIYRSRTAVYDTVDHIVPLVHELVCGLHVPWNLKRATRQENCAKNNTYWPDCPDHLCPEKNLPADIFGHPQTYYQTSLAL